MEEDDDQDGELNEHADHDKHDNQQGDHEQGNHDNHNVDHGQIDPNVHNVQGQDYDHDGDDEEHDDNDDFGEKYCWEENSLDSEEKRANHFDDDIEQVEDLDEVDHVANGRENEPETNKGKKKKQSCYSTRNLPHPDDLVRLFEVLCCWDAFTREKEMCKKKDVHSFVWMLKERIKRMLAMVFAILPRKDGNGWCLSKIHDILHIPDYIQINGAPYNWCTEICESNHTQHAKDVAATAQKRKEEIFLPQVGRRVDTMLMLDHIRSRAGLEAWNPISSQRPNVESWYTSKNTQVQHKYCLLGPWTRIYNFIITTNV